MRTAIAAILILLTCGGCSTIATLARTSEDCWLYSGTRQDLRLLRGSPYDCTGLGCLAGLIDFPWSLALDTALAPVTLPLQLILGSPDPTPSPRTRD